MQRHRKIPVLVAQKPSYYQRKGGIAGSASMEASAADPNTSVRLHIRDRVTGELFLIDTGAEISLLPIGNASNKTPSNFKLYAANNTQINTYGESFRILHLGLRPLTWNFCVASVPYPIIGADLMKHYGLLPDLKGRRLIDSHAFTSGIVKAISPVAISTVNPSTQFARILPNFRRSSDSSSQFQLRIATCSIT